LRELDTGTRTGSYAALTDALAEALHMLEDTLTGLREEDWTRPTLLRTANAETPPWDVLELAAHFDVFMGLVLNLVEHAEEGRPTLDRASFCIALSDSSQGPVLYRYMADHAKGHDPETMLSSVRDTFERALEAIRTTPPDTVGPAFYGQMRLDEFVATRVVEAVVHGMDLTDALGRPPLDMPRAVPTAAEILDEVVARTRVPGRPADLVDDDLAFIRAAAGRGEHPDPRFPVVR
jgi:uncharacterized protein (TIGR03083 family)